MWAEKAKDKGLGLKGWEDGVVLTRRRSCGEISGIIRICCPRARAQPGEQSRDGEPEEQGGLEARWKVVQLRKTDISLNFTSDFAGVK